MQQNHTRQPTIKKQQKHTDSRYIYR